MARAAQATSSGRAAAAAAEEYRDDEHGGSSIGLFLPKGNDKVDDTMTLPINQETSHTIDARLTRFDSHNSGKGNDNESDSLQSETSSSSDDDEDDVNEEPAADGLSVVTRNQRPATGGNAHPYQSGKRSKRPATPISSPVTTTLAGTNGKRNYKKAKTCVAAAVTRTHSPCEGRGKLGVGADVLSCEPTITSFSNPAVQAVAPTLRGIQDLVRHLKPQRRKPLDDKERVIDDTTAQHHHHHAVATIANKKASTLAALPTECTYEVCCLVSWSKNETLNNNEISFRARQLDHLKYAASNESLHVYVPHHNIRLMDKILDFPKKKYALTRCPETIANFNESRVIFQRLADLFWPGACVLYLSPESSAPQGLVQQLNISGRSSRDRDKTYIGFRCPSHPLTVRVQKQLQMDASQGPLVLIGSSVREGPGAGETVEGTIEGYSSSDSSVSLSSPPLLKAKNVIRKFHESFSSIDSTVVVLQGEERKEIFAVPTCQFQDVVLECWIDASSRTISLRGKSSRTVQAQHVLTSSSTKNAVLRNVLQRWKVVDERDGGGGSDV